MPSPKASSLSNPANAAGGTTTDEGSRSTPAIAAAPADNESDAASPTHAVGAQVVGSPQGRPSRSRGRGNGKRPREDTKQPTTEDAIAPQPPTTASSAVRKSPLCKKPVGSPNGHQPQPPPSILPTLMEPTPQQVNEPASAPHDYCDVDNDENEEQQTDDGTTVSSRKRPISVSSTTTATACGDGPTAAGMDEESSLGRAQTTNVAGTDIVAPDDSSSRGGIAQPSLTILSNGQGNSPQPRGPAPGAHVSQAQPPVSIPSSPSTNSSSLIAPGAQQAGQKRRQMTLADFQPPPPIEVVLRKELEDKSAKIDALQQRVTSLESTVAHHTSAYEHATAQVQRYMDQEARYRTSLFNVMQDLAQTSRREARRQQHSLHFELGHVITAPPVGGGFGGAGSGGARELWVEGNRTRDLLRQQHELARREVAATTEKKDLERKLQSLRKQGATPATITESLLRGDESSTSMTMPTALLQAPGGSAATAASPSAAVPPGAAGAVTGGTPEPAQPTQAAIAKVNIQEALDTEERLQAIRREIEATEAEKLSIAERLTLLEAEKKVFLKEIRRISDEDSSEFATRVSIGDQNRYVLINLLGKGGFSEVWKAYDLWQAQFVACKIHKVGREMAAVQKQSYIRHAERELAIMRTLNHPKVTKLLDVFEPDANAETFVAVMEYCAGMDLDTYLKSHRTMKESDAKTIMVQLIAALRHMADHPRPVIHYDLKPANILFEDASPLCLDIKITDFGLSKVMTNAKEEAMRSNQHAGIDLTSQGTGTYWYLPPECFDTSRIPTITAKVDVWAVGVIFFQMLYGRRPFADGVSQRRIWEEKLISQQAMKPVEFPPNVGTTLKVSDDAKAVIQKCLMANPQDRCDIFQLSADNYFRRAVGGRGGGGATAQNTTIRNDAMPPPAPTNRTTASS